MLWLLLIGMLSPPPQGACAGAADRQWLAANFTGLEDTSRSCAFDCLTDDAACAARCMADETPLSAACTGCFGAFIDCTTSHCALRCIAPSSDMCVDCRAEHCQPAFERCAGVAVRR